MIDRIIDFSVRNKFLVLLLVAAAALIGAHAARTVPLASTTLPPTLRLLRMTASTTAESGMRKARRRFGSTLTWYCRPYPPSEATSETPGTDFIWYRRFQS